MRIHSLSIALVLLLAPAFTFAADAEAPHIFLDKSPVIVAYQLRRLTNAQLMAVPRKDDDKKYIPVYEAILTRKGMTKDLRAESANALAKLQKASVAAVVLKGIGKVGDDDAVTVRELTGLLMTQPPKSLAADRDTLKSLASDSDSAITRQTAFAALAVVDNKPDDAWALAKSSDGGMIPMLHAVGIIPDAKLRAMFYDDVKLLTADAPDDATKLAAVDALGFIPHHDAAVFAELSKMIASDDADLRLAAVHSIRHMPPSHWPKDQLAAAAKNVVALVKATPSADRTQPKVIEAVQLGNDLAAKMPPAQGLPIRHELRELAVRVVMIRTLPEQMLFDVRYFAVQAGKPVQIVLDNTADAMQHNLVITNPGKLVEIGTKSASLQPPADPAAKAYIPDDPNVLFSTHLLNPGDTATLSFNAPAKPGAYDFMCSFPGHFVRMYGVMLVVKDLDQWEAHPTVPIDPFTKKPFDSQKHELGETTAAGAVDNMHH